MTESSQPSWLTVKLLSQAMPAFTPAAIRNLIFNASDRKTSKCTIKGNGLSPYIRRVVSKLLINHEGFFSWIDNQESGN